MTYQKVLRKDGTPEPYLLLNSETGKYYVRKFKAGRGELFRSTGTSSIKEAREIRDDLILEFEGRRKLGRMRIRDVTAELRVELEQEFRAGQRRQRTWDHDRTYLPIIDKYFGERYADEIDERAWKIWALEFKGKRDLFDLAKYLSKVLTFAFSRGAIPRKPAIRAPKQSVRSVEIYSDEDIKKFIDHADPALRDLIVLAAECGMRPHETRELKWKWVSFRDGVAVITLPAAFTKTSRDRSFEAGPNASKVLIERYAFAETDFVFPAPKDHRRPISDVQLSKLWRRMLKRAGITRVVQFHWLRHTFYTKALLEAQIPVQLVSEYGGTSIVTLQKHYLRGDARRTSVVSKAVNLNLGEEK